MKKWKPIVVAISVLCVPVVATGNGLVDFRDHGAAYAKSDNKGGKSDNGNNGGGKADKDRGGGKSKDKGHSGKSETKSAKARGNEASPGGKGPKAVLNKLKSVFGKKDTKTVAVRPARTKAVSKGQAKKAVITASAAATGGVLHSQLKSLNSLNRNINGLVNSNDPKMEPFREFIAAAASNEEARNALEVAASDLDASREAYEEALAGLSLSDDPAVAASELEQRLAKHADAEPIEPTEPVLTEDNADTFADLQADWQVEHAAWQEAHDAWADEGVAIDNAKAASDQLAADTTAFEEAEMAASENADASSPEAMRQAMIDSLNATGAGPVTDEDITPEMEAWVAERLGVGEQDGLIDDYVAMQDEEAAGEGSAADNGGETPEDAVEVQESGETAVGASGEEKETEEVILTSAQQ